MSCRGCQRIRRVIGIARAPEKPEPIDPRLVMSIVAGVIGGIVAYLSLSL